MPSPAFLHGTGKKGIKMEQKGGEIHDGKGIFPAFCPGGELYYQVQQFREIKRSSYRTLVE